jgi:hypothetical protein
MNQECENSVQSVITILNDQNLSDTTKVEYFGYFLRRLTLKYMNSDNANSVGFNSIYFRPEALDGLAKLADKICGLINPSDPSSSIASFCDVVIKICAWWTNEKLEVKINLLGVVESVMSMDWGKSITSSNSDRIMASRRSVIVRGALRHISNWIERTMKNG